MRQFAVMIKNQLSQRAKGITKSYLIRGRYVDSVDVNGDTISFFVLYVALFDAVSKHGAAIGRKFDAVRLDFFFKIIKCKASVADRL